MRCPKKLEEGGSFLLCGILQGAGDFNGSVPVSLRVKSELDPIKQFGLGFGPG